jgi:uncharacterized protein YqgC (DUF456 family)
VIDSVAWACALGGLALGGLGVLVPGFPGCAVALLGLVAFAGLTDFAVVTHEALVLAAGFTLAGAAAQLAGPALASRAMAGTAGAATGAALGAALGTLVPVPGFAYGAAVLGALVLGVAGGWKGVAAWLRGVVGAAGGCCVSAAADGLAVLACGAVLGVADYLAAVG